MPSFFSPGDWFSDPTRYSDIARAKAGDVPARQRLMEKADQCVRVWCAKCYRAVGSKFPFSPDDIDQLAHEMVVDLLKIVDQFDPARNPDADNRFRRFLWGWLRNKWVWLNAARAKDPLSLTHLPEPQAPSCLDSLVAESDDPKLRRLEAAIAIVRRSTPKDEWDPFEQYQLYRVPGPEIAERLGVSLDVVHQRFSRLRAAIRAEYRQLTPEGEQ